MRCLLLLGVILAVCLDLSAGVQEAWIHRYNAGRSTGTNQPVAAVLDRQGNLIVAGSSTGSQGDFDYVILKYTPTGSNVWVRRFTSFDASDDQVRALVVDEQDQIYVTGTSVTIKHASDGTQLWTAPYGGRSMALDTNGNVYVTGYLTNDFATVKLDSSGSNVWERTYDKIGQNDVSQQVALDSEQNVYVVGPEIWAFEPRQPAYYQRFRLISYTPQGSVRLTYQVPGGFFRPNCEVRSLYPSDGGVVFTGNLSPDGLGVIYCTFKIDFTTSSNWFASWVNGSHVGETASTSYNGDIFLTGAMQLNTFGHSQYATMKVRADQLMINDRGIPAWRTDYEGLTPGINRANAIALDSAGNVYVTGQSSGTGIADDRQDWATIKYSPEGKELWVKRWNGAAKLDDVATCMAVTPNGQVYVAGWSRAASHFTELVLVKYGELENLQVQPDRASLQFFGTPGQTYRIDASTNLPYWDLLSLATADADGIYRYDDTNAASFSMRFYRTGPP